MKMRSLVKRFKNLMFAIRNGSLGDKLRFKRLEKQRLCYIRDDAVHYRQLQDSVYRMLERDYGSIVAAAPDARPRQSGENGIPKIVWWCWLQGVEAAPELVRTCLESVRRHMPDYEIRIITEENYAEYISLPDYVLERRRDGFMSPNHFANLIRLELLLRYGGVWIDATILLTGDGLRQILDQTDELFMPRISYANFRLTAENWLIAARPDNEILRLTQQLHYAYWKDHKLAATYMFFFLFFTMAAKRYPEQWHAVYPYCREQSFLLVDEMERPFDPLRYEQICKSTSFHKLTWKKRFSAQTGSFYDVLIHQRKY